MDSKDILGIFNELTENKYNKYYGKLSEIEKNISSIKLTKEDTAILINLLIEDEIFAWLDFISSKLDLIAEDSSFFINLVISIINKIKGDLAQGSFIKALVGIGEKNSELGLKIYDKIITSTKDEIVISYAGFILGGVGKVEPKKVMDYILKILKSEVSIGIDLIKIAVIKAVRIMAAEKQKLDNSEFYFTVLEIVSDINNSDNLKSEALHLNFELFRFNNRVCFTNIFRLTFEKPSDTLQYQVANRLWIYGLGENYWNMEFILIKKCSESDNKNVLRRVAHYLAQNHNKNKEVSFKIVSDWIKRNAPVYELYYVLNEMGKSEFDYYWNEMKNWINEENDTFVLQLLLFSLDHLVEKNIEAKKKLPELRKIILDRVKKVRNSDNK